MATYTLAHISDPHLGPLPPVKKRQLISKRVLGYTNWKRHRGKGLTNQPLDELIADLKAQKADHLAVTGDLVNIALPKEIENAALWLSSLGAPEDVSLVPGNHDAYVPGALKKAFNAWQPYMAGGNQPKSDKPLFPYVRRRGPLAIVGLSTAVATNAFMATGALGYKQRQKLKDILGALKNEDVFRVILIHHPPYDSRRYWHKRLIDRSKFRAIVGEHGADLVLHGHTHRVSLQHIPHEDREIPVVGVPSASSGTDGRYEPGRYNLFHIDKTSDGWHCQHVQRGRDEDGNFVTLDEKLL